MSGTTSSLLALLLCVAVPAQAMNHTLKLTHGNDPKSHIAIHITDSDRGKLYAFRYCETEDASNCTRIGRHESYRESHLQALEANCRTTARVVLWTEIAIITAVVGGILYYGWLHPLFFAEIKNKAGHVSTHGRSQSLPAPQKSSSRGGEEAFSLPESSPVPLEAARSLKSPLAPATPPPDQPLQPEALPETMGYVANMIAWGYSNLAGPALGIAFWNVKDEILTRFQDIVYLSLRFLSPAEHYRAATLLHDITNSDTNLHYTKRDYSSIEEYFDQYQVENLEHLRRKLENLLVVTPR